MSLRSGFEAAPVAAAGIVLYPRGSIYTTILESGSQSHTQDGLLGPNSIMVVYMEPLGMFSSVFRLQECRVWRHVGRMWSDLLRGSNYSEFS